MKPFRKHLAIAIDGGGIRGIIVTQALRLLEDHLGAPLHDRARLVVGTSTGSIISAGIASGLSARRMTQLYMQMGETIFPDTLRKLLFPLTRYRYPAKPLRSALAEYFGDAEMGDFWKGELKTDLVITAYDLQKNSTRFIKPWKSEYEHWQVAQAVLASCTVPTYFPVVDGRYIDGGVGSYGNPCYVAAYEAKECLDWHPLETTLISIGTGRAPYSFDEHTAGRLWAWDWIGRALGAFSQSAYDQQVHLVETYFEDLDFRRFQINMDQPIAMDDTSQYERLLAYGTQLGRMILADQTDSAQGIVIKRMEFY